MRRWGTTTFLLLTLSVATARGQELDGVDLQGLPLPLAARGASTLESSQPLGAKDFLWTLRTTGLDRPLALRLPSTSPEGTKARIIEGVVLTELSAAVGLGSGWDAGVGLGAHLHQSGPEAGADDSNGFGARDPRLGLGWSKSFRSLYLRPFAQVTLPLGNPEALAGERAARLKVGGAFSATGSLVDIRTETSLIYRPPLEISSTTLGPRFLFGASVLFHLMAKLDAGVEIIVQPGLSRQTSRSGESGGTVVPAEVLATLRHRLSDWSFGLGGGTGVPLSRTSTVNSQQQFVRGPTSPVFRGFADITFEK